MLELEDIKADKWLSCFLAVDAAKSCIHIWSKEYPKDEKPNKAIEAAEAWLNNPCKETASAASAAAAAAYAAADAYAASTYAAPSTYADDATADAAYYTAYAAAAAAAAATNAAADAAAYAAYYAADAAYYASKVLNQNKEEYINNHLVKHLPFIVDYKIKHNQSFGDFEAVLKAASGKDKEKLLFHLNLNDKE